jgi:hypothetical protein
MRAAGSLLLSANSTSALIALVQQAGIAGQCVPLEATEVSRLGLDELRDVHLGAAAGACRVVIGALDGSSGGTAREIVHRIARRLHGRSPHVLWLLAIADVKMKQCFLAAWSESAKGAPRVAAFAWSPDTVVDSDIETLKTLAGCRAADDVALHAGWLEVLGRDALTRRFFRSLDSQVTKLAAAAHSTAAADDARDLATLYATRLLFLHFLQAKGWLDGQPTFLADRLDDCLVTGGRFHERVLLPLFFGTLNTPVRRRSRLARGFGRIPFLNGGLFSRAAVERRLTRHRWSDERFASLFDELFLRFRFVGREDTAPGPRLRSIPR